jgi:hypothetical protein
MPEKVDGGEGWGEGAAIGGAGSGECDIHHGQLRLEIYILLVRRRPVGGRQRCNPYRVGESEASTQGGASLTLGFRIQPRWGWGPVCGFALLVR